MYTSANSCVDRLNTESSRDSASWLMSSDPICYLPKMFQVGHMHDKTGCVQALPIQLARVNSSIVQSYDKLFSATMILYS